LQVARGTAMLLADLPHYLPLVLGWAPKSMNQKE